MSHRVIFAPEARDQLDHLYRYIATAAHDEAVARRFVEGIIDYAETLGTFPDRGTPRETIRTGLRTLAWRRRVTLAYVVEARDVVVVGVFYAGQDFETLLKDD